MKKLFFIPVLFLLLISCSNNSEDNLLVGKWKLSEALHDNGGLTTTEWVPIDDGYEIVFLENNIFMATQISGCESGTYTVENGIITLTYNCSNIGFPNKYKINSNTANELIISNINCDEECYDKFTKIN